MTDQTSTLTLTGSRNLPKKTLGQTLAALTAFQTFLGVATEAAALEKIFYEARGGATIAADGRHILIHSEPTATQTLTGVGSASAFNASGKISVDWFGPVPSGDVDNDPKALTDFAAAVAAVEDALLANPHSAGGLLIHTIDQLAAVRGDKIIDQAGDPFVWAGSDLFYG